MDIHWFSTVILLLPGERCAKSPASSIVQTILCIMLTEEPTSICRWLIEIVINVPVLILEFQMANKEVQLTYALNGEEVW